MHRERIRGGPCSLRGSGAGFARPALRRRPGCPALRGSPGAITMALRDWHRLSVRGPLGDFSESRIPISTKPAARARHGAKAGVAGTGER
jgi:hypothetical protein